MNIQNEKELIENAVSGNRESLETLLSSVRDLVFNLSLRMLGTVQDAEDATQEILIKVMTNLSSFRQESRFTTWVFRIASNHLQDYRKHMFAARPLSFEYYGMDIAGGREKDVPDLSGGVDRGILAQELKLSCTNVMLQCLDAQSRCIFILGTMFRLDSRIAGEIMGLSPEAYRQRLSRIRKTVGVFLREYCGLSGTGICDCARRVNYAIANHRIDPSRLEYQSLGESTYREMTDFIDTMDEIDELSQVFADLPALRSTEKTADFIREMVASQKFQGVLDA